MEEKRMAENNTPLDYSREGILTSFSGTLKLSANQPRNTNHAGVVASQHLQTDWPVHRIIAES
jgi:hypothetical protein